MIGTADARMSEYFGFDILAAFRGIDPIDWRARFGDRLQITPDLATLEPYPRFPEDEASLFARVAAVRDDWLARDDWTRGAFYGHWATVAALTTLLDPSVTFEPGHCSVTHVVEQEPGRWQVVTVNGQDHLSADPS